MYKKTEFKRNQDPLTAMGVGIVKEIEDWLNKEGTTNAGYNIRPNKDRKGFIIDIDGDVVFKDFEIVNAKGIKGVYNIEFEGDTVNITILNQLSKEEVYTRIRDYYNSILNNCMGKTIEEQQDYLFGKNHMGNNPVEIKLKADLIEESEDYIKKLPDKPTPDQINDLGNQILSGILEYACPARDKFSVQMKQYAEVLLKINLKK